MKSATMRNIQFWHKFQSSYSIYLFFVCFIIDDMIQVNTRVGAITTAIFFRRDKYLYNDNEAVKEEQRAVQFLRIIRVG